MRTFYILVVPLVLLGGLLLGVQKLSKFSNGESSCEIGACSTEIYEGDAGETFMYAKGTLFTLFLDERKDPSRSLTCHPEGIVQIVPSISTVDPPLYAATFMGISAGTCSIVGSVFTATIVIK